jgi:hypothetical protein
LSVETSVARQQPASNSSVEELQCEAACPQECDVTDYPGTLSISQISSQATSQLLDANRNRISTAYTSAVELSARINNNIVFMRSLKTIYEQSSTVLSNINTALSQIKSIGDQISIFNSIFVNKDLSYLSQNALNDLLTSYQAKYKSVRQKAAMYISDSASQLTDLFFKMTASPNSFDNVLPAYRFYSEIAALLDRCILSTGLASTYLTEALQLETVYGDMSTFYDHNSRLAAFQPCYLILELHVEMYSEVALVLAHVQFRVNHWLQNNENAAFDLGAQKMQMLSTGTVVEPTVGTMTTVSTTDTVTQANTTTADNNTIPGVQLLVDCPNCFIIIDVVKKVLKYSDRASSCLSEYEDVLIGTLAAIDSLPDPPAFTGSVALYAALDQFQSFSEELSHHIHEYLTGNISGAACATAATSTLQDMALRVQTITDEVKTTVNTFVNTANSTCLAWNASYNGILHNMTDLIPAFITNTTATALYEALSEQAIWQEPVLSMDGVAVFTYRVTTAQENQRIFNMQHLHMFNFSSINFTLVTLTKFVADNCNQYVSTIQSEGNTWSDLRSNVGIDISTYTNSLQLDSTFIRLERERVQ